LPWISQVSVDAATGELREEFDKALKRSGRVWNIVHIMSLNPRALKASIQLYQAVLFAPSPLSRVQRELLAVVVSVELACHY